MKPGARDALGAAMSEDDLLQAVADTAIVAGWRVHHSRPARNAAGRHMTPVQGHPGLPDLVMAHPVHGVAFVELKSERGILRPEQVEWLDVLTAFDPGSGGSDFLVAVWRPSHWLDGTIDRTLRGLQ